MRPGLTVIAYNLGNLWRRLALPARAFSRLLTGLHQRLVKTGAFYQVRLLLYYHVITNAAGEPSTYTWTCPQTGCTNGGPFSRGRLDNRADGLYGPSLY